MYASATWINDYLASPLDPEAQADLLTRAGFPLEEREDVESEGRADVRQDFEMTSNRGDCTCHLGMAREIAAIGGHELRVPEVTLEPAADAPDASTLASLANEDPDGCPRYTARVIRGVKVGPSPQWLADRLRWRGDIPRNNVVDATNFVLFEYGQPTHVFDLAKLAGPGIVVRRARGGERMTPLGEGAKPIELSDTDLVIADAERPVALAGVKGGAGSSVDESTTDILVEVATFDPVMVRNASRRHGIGSDSSYRFERGVHPGHLDAAADRLVSLIIEIAGGELCPGVLEAGRPVPAARTARMRPARARRILGLDLDDATMIGMLERLGFGVKPDGDWLECTVPVHRLDIEREVDLIEEVARMHGLDTIPVHESIPVRVRPTSPRESARRAVADVLAGLGFVETVTHSLVGDTAAAAFMPDGLAALRVDDERAGAEPVLRPSVLPSLARVAAFNRAHGGTGLRFFEEAATFALQGEQHIETRNLGLMLEVSEDDAHPLRELRGTIDRLVELLRGPEATVDVEASDDVAWLAPGAVVRIDGEMLGTMGLLSAAAAEASGLEGRWAVAELGTPALAETPAPDREARALPSFPAIERDLSLVVADDVPWRSLAAAVAGCSLPDLESCELVTVYRGKGVPDGSRVVTMRLRFRSGERTLVHTEIDPHVVRATAALASDCGAELRG